MPDHPAIPVGARVRIDDKCTNANGCTGTVVGHGYGSVHVALDSHPFGAWPRSSYWVFSAHMVVPLPVDAFSA